MAKFTVDFEYVWKVENSHLLNPDTVSLVKTPEFKMPTIPPTKWTLGYFNRPFRQQNTLHFFIMRASDDDGPSVVFLKFTLSIEDSIVGAHKINRRISLPFRKGDCLFPCMKHNHPKLKIPVGNIFSIKWDFVIIHSVMSSDIGDEKDIKILSRDMNNLLENEILTDTVLNTRDHAVFKLHKSVLWACFPYLLKHVDPEETSKQLEIPQDTLKKILRYAYSGYLANEDSGILCDILTAVQTDNTTNEIGSIRELPSKLHVHSRVNHSSASFEFSIKNLHEWDSNEEVFSPSLNLGINETSEYRLIAQVSSLESERCEGAELVLCVRVEAKTPDPSYLSCKVIAISTKKTQNFYSDCSINQGEQNTFQFVFFINESNLDCKWKSESCPLTFKCMLTATDGSISHSSCGMYLKQRHPLSDNKFLSFDLRKLLMNTEFSDVNLIVGDKELPAHKAILAARSPVFCRMFQTDMVENTTHRVTITDANSEVIDSLLQYIYTAEIKVRSKMNVTELYAVADKYELLELKGKCAQYLMCNLNTEIAHEVLAVADMHCDKRLKTTAERFIMAHEQK